MRKFITFSTLLISFCQLSAQKQRLVNVYLQGQLNWTRYDITKVNNNTGFGLGAQAFLHTKSKFNATLELTADKYWGKKVLLVYRTSSLAWGNKDIIPSVDGMVNLFAGTTWNPSKIFYMGIAAGPSFINGNVHAGFKPAIGLFSRNQRWTTRLSFIHLVNRDLRTKEDFGAASFSIGYRVH
jgi:hypothetical protein